MTSAFDIELALDRFEARLARDLPPFYAASATAYATSTVTHAAPPHIAPADIALVRSAFAIAELRTRATQLLRMLGPLVVEADATVARLRESAPSWAGLRPLAAARDAVATRLFGKPFAFVVGAFAGVVLPPPPPAMYMTAPRAATIPDPPAGWREPDGLVVDDAAIRALWASLAVPGIGALSISRARDAHPRTFVVERGVAATIVIPAAIATPAQRFSLLHELGHAWLWLHPVSRAREWPRALDEACASHFGRMLESPTRLPAGWAHPAAAAARARRTDLAFLLEHLENTAIANPAALAEDPGLPSAPPWALWHDPSAQPSYLSAEYVAGAIPAEMTGDALAGHFAQLADEADARIRF